MDNYNGTQPFWGNLLPQDFEPEPIGTSQQKNQPSLNWQRARSDRAHDDLLTRRLMPFAHRLHHMLDDVENRGKQYIVSWTPNGRSFKVHKPAQFVREIAPTYFNLTQYKSFKRQLLNYGFVRVENSQDHVVGAFHHPHFIRDDLSQCNLIVRGNPPLSPSKVAIKESPKQIPKTSSISTAALPSEKPVMVNQQIPTPRNKVIDTPFDSRLTTVTSESDARNWELDCFSEPTSNDDILSNFQLCQEAGIHSDVSLDGSHEDEDLFSHGSLDGNLPGSFNIEGLNTMDWISTCVSLPDLTYVLDSYNSVPKKMDLDGNGSARLPIDVDGALDGKSEKYSEFQQAELQAEIVSLFGSDMEHSSNNKRHQNDLSMKKPAAMRWHPPL